MIVGKRAAPKSERKEWAYYQLGGDEADQYVRGGSAAVDCSPPGDGEIDYSRDWKAI